MTTTDQSSSPASTDHGHPKRGDRPAATTAKTTPAVAMSTRASPTPPNGNMPQTLRGRSDRLLILGPAPRAAAGASGRRQHDPPPGTAGQVAADGWMSSGLVRQRIEPPPLWNSETSSSSISKPHVLELGANPVGQAGISDRAADHDRVGAEGQRLLLGQHERLRHQRQQRRAPRPRRRRPGRPSRGGRRAGRRPGRGGTSPGA